jgi:hypothetical protein
VRVLFVTALVAFGLAYAPLSYADGAARSLDPPPSSIRLPPLRLHLDSGLLPWVAAFTERDHPEIGRALLIAAEDSGSRSGQVQAQGDYRLFGRDFTLLITRFPAASYQGLPLWMSELAVHFAIPKDRQPTESTLFVDVVGQSNLPPALYFGYRLSF